MSDDITRKNPDNPFATRKRPGHMALELDNEGQVLIPGKDPLPLIGEMTSGFGWNKFKSRMSEAVALNEHIEGLMKKTWKCSNCSRVWKGSQLSITSPPAIGNPNVESLLDFLLKYKPMCPGRSPEREPCGGMVEEVKQPEVQV